MFVLGRLYINVVKLHLNTRERDWMERIYLVLKAVKTKKLNIITECVFILLKLKYLE